MKLASNSTLTPIGVWLKRLVLWPRLGWRWCHANRLGIDVLVWHFAFNWDSGHFCSVALHFRPMRPELRGAEHLLAWQLYRSWRSGSITLTKRGGRYWTLRKAKWSGVS